jgi:hypothetical protein
MQCSQRDLLFAQYKDALVDWSARIDELGKTRRSIVGTEEYERRQMETESAKERAHQLGIAHARHMEEHGC